MSAHVLLNLLNELGKRDTMRGLPSILSLFRNEFSKFNNTRVYLSYDIKISLKFHFWRKKTYNCVIIMDVMTFQPLVVYRFYCTCVTSLPDATSYNKSI